MESLCLSSFCVKLAKEYEKNSQPWIYCVLRWSEQAFCSKSKENIFKDWVPLITNQCPLQMDFPKNHNLFKLEIWDYDNQEKIGETNVTNGDLPVNQKQKQFSINDRKVHLKFIYERKGRLQQLTESGGATVRISYNKSDVAKIIQKPGSAYVRKVLNPSEESTTNTYVATVKYDPTYYGKWKFIPARNQSTSQKLKL